MKREKSSRTEPRAANPRAANDRPLGLLLSLTSLVVAVTCSGNISSRPGTATPSAGAGAAPAAHTASELEPGQPRAVATADEPDAVVEEAPSEQGPLAHFFHALRALEQTHTGHVRIAWFGDSHTAADFWTGKVRARLQERFGVGGPGFVEVGLKGYRHAQVQTEVHGKWQHLPTRPARTKPFADGVFGLAGQRLVAQDKAVFQATPKKDVVQGRAHWTLRFRLYDGSRFRVTLGDVQKDVSVADLPKGADLKAVASVSFEGEPQAPLKVQQLNGLIEFFGVVLEGSAPGVVLDTLGIDGAKARTPLAWDADAWKRELAAREPELAVFAYGTNEVFETHEPSEYGDQLRELLGRVREAVPSISCLIVGPTDVMHPRGESHERVFSISQAQRKAASVIGCAYVGAHELMGGERSYFKWSQAKPRLAGNDGVHLTIKGYEELGERTARFLLTGYDESAP